ncbi:hypothetical protein B484DRAFT_430501 [Ochromonadaceae sp. CCMP2298]|nr:hypothetical protein B484DRAFT_430501 [Ochromonadaceae sp. CCMP2298]
MFAKQKRKSARKRIVGSIKQLAHYASPTKSSSVGVEDLSKDASAGKSLSTATMATSESVNSALSLATMKTGDKTSYSITSNDQHIHIQRGVSQRGYRVLSYRESRNGVRSIFDILDGKPYYCGVGLQKRITSEAIVFNTRSEALSERFPSNQFCGSKGGNGTLPRILVSFEAWGHCRARHGGVPSKVCEFVRYLSIVEYLDPPHPTTSRNLVGYVQPHNFPLPDNQPPNRNRTGKFVKKFRMFHPRRGGAVAVAYRELLE